VANIIAATIGRTCSFDAKNRLVGDDCFALSRYPIVNKKFFAFSDFPAALPAHLVEIDRQSGVGGRAAGLCAGHAGTRRLN